MEDKSDHQVGETHKLSKPIKENVDAKLIRKDEYEEKGKMDHTGVDKDEVVLMENKDEAED